MLRERAIIKNWDLVWKVKLADDNTMVAFGPVDTATGRIPCHVLKKDQFASWELNDTYKCIMEKPFMVAPSTVNRLAREGGRVPDHDEALETVRLINYVDHLGDNHYTYELIYFVECKYGIFYAKGLPGNHMVIHELNNSERKAYLDGTSLFELLGNEWSFLDLKSRKETKSEQIVDAISLDLYGNYDMLKMI